MSADKFIIGFRKDEVAYLRASVYAIELLEIDGVPEPNALIGRATSSSQETSV